MFVVYASFFVSAPPFFRYLLSSFAVVYFHLRLRCYCLLFSVSTVTLQCSSLMSLLACCCCCCSLWFVAAVLFLIIFTFRYCSFCWVFVFFFYCSPPSLVSAYVFHSYRAAFLDFRWRNSWKYCEVARRRRRVGNGWKYALLIALPVFCGQLCQLQLIFWNDCYFIVSLLYHLGSLFAIQS